MIKIKSLIFQGHKLKQLRDSHKPNPLTMQDVYKETGIKPGALSEIENGINKNPRPATVDKLCTLFGVDAIFFYYDGEDLTGLFPSNIPLNIRQFMFDINNLSFIQLAMKIQQTSLTAEEAENIIMLYAKSVDEVAAKRP